MHRDLVHIRWSSDIEELLERLELDDPRVSGPNRWKQALSGWASYVYISEPHEQADCPFKDSDFVRFA